MSPEEDNGGEAERRSRKLRYRIAFFTWPSTRPSCSPPFTVRALLYIHDEAGMAVLRRRVR